MKNFPFTNLVNNLEVVRPLGSAIPKVQIPENKMIKLNDYADKIIKNDKVATKLNHNKYLAGKVKQEFIIDSKFEFQKFF